MCIQMRAVKIANAAKFTEIPSRCIIYLSKCVSKMQRYERKNFHRMQMDDFLENNKSMTLGSRIENAFLTHEFHFENQTKPLSLKRADVPVKVARICIEEKRLKTKRKQQSLC